jgi:glycosyltransferase involved in cell wall biosynthesis
MHILFVNKAPIPVVAYGGTERVIWDLGKSLVRLGHRVSYLVPEGSHCEFARVITIRPGLGWHEQVPDGIDLVHFQFNPEGADAMDAPYLVTQHGNSVEAVALPRNTVFVSRNHAQRHGSTEYVYNGLDWDAYGPVDFSRPRSYFHFLGKAAWRVKNVRGAIDVATDAGVELLVMGGDRLNLKRGFRFTWSRRVRFAGMVGGQQKLDMLNGSRGMIFPVLWHEPFGLAVIESLYFGCPVFATPYGALPELVPKDCGMLSASRTALAEAVRQRQFDGQACHRHAVAHFSAEAMAQGYLEKYARILDGEVLNPTAPVMTANPKALAWLK